jgi:hypothetical protein
MFFGCKHSFDRLAVEKEHTTSVIDDDYTAVDYHLYCTKCHKVLVLKHAKCNFTIDEMINKLRAT